MSLRWLCSCLCKPRFPYGLFFPRRRRVLDFERIDPAMCEKTTNVPALFGKMVFGEQQMQQRLPATAYQKWQQCLAQGTPLDRTTAGEIANAMKDWAIEKGATHYTHWFQPMTGVTAEKHDSFITRDGKDGVVMELSAKYL